jgi:RNA polymerase sigma-70 factor (ECF subfamily)
VTAPCASTFRRVLAEMTDDSAAAPVPVAVLTQRLAAGEVAAFEEFHSAYCPRLFRYVLVLLRGDEHAARDVLQETLLRVARHARRFDDERTLWDWLARLARTAAADHGRKNSRYRRFLERFTQHAALPAPPDDDALARTLEAALDTLVAPERELLYAKYHRGESVRALAAAQGISEDALESRLARARAALRDLVFRKLRAEETHDSNGHTPR